MIERSIAPTVGHYAISAITATRLPVHFVWGLADDVFDAQAGGGTGPSAA